MKNGGGRTAGTIGRFAAALLADAAWLVPALLAGCTALGYRLGSALPRDIRAVSVAPFVNRTREPQLEAETTRAMLQEIQKDGNLRVVAPEQADAILEVTLTEFEQAPIRYDRRDVTMGREFRMKATARVVFRRKTQEEKLVDRPVIGEARFEATGDLSTPKREALPRLAQDLAHRILESVAECW
ncbi:MAG: LptE family protein [Verrucomicrobiota bacterium]|nr:LptE family protein [Verrucomicrobiota bacterium]